MNYRSRNHRDAHLDDAPEAEIPEMALVHRGEPGVASTATQFAALINTLRTDGCFAYDSEFITERSYHPRLCLVQVASSSTLALIDPLAGFDLTPFWELLADPAVTKIVHAGESDIEPVARLLGRPAAGVFDTQIAAGFVGLPYPMSLKKLVLELAGVDLGRDLGFSDWAQRPLSAIQIRYAADDVRYLLAVHRELAARLEALGRTADAKEECDAACAVDRFGFKPETHYLRVRGGNVLPALGKAVLRELTVWRDGAARLHDKPPRSLLKDEVMIELARVKPGSAAELAKIRGLPRSVVEAFATDIVAACVRASALPKAAWPTAEPELSPTDKLRSDTLFEVLQSLCAESKLDPGLVASRKELVKFYRYAALGVGAIPELLQGWRGTAVGSTLASFLADHADLAGAWATGLLHVNGKPLLPLHAT
jgi:ribonuclease D